VLESVAHDAEHLRMLRSLGFRSLINVPLVAHGRVLGALGFATGDSGRRLGPRDLDLAVELARRAAVAVEHTRLYADAQAARREAEAANRAKSEFLGTMSHELRTPLNAISGYAELLDLEIRGPLTDAQRQDLARIRRNSQYLLSLINDVLNFARLGAGRVEMRIADVRLAEVIAGLEALVAPQVHAKGLSYEPGVHDPALAARADPERLQQVLLNLLTNAIKFTDAGGRIVLSCEAATDAVRVRVRDTGRGVPADELGRIFEPFVQVDRHPTHGSQQGVGLGLAISRELARAMGGEITVESTVGAGSTFTLTLPRPAGAAR
jgi:signal transduction histidine kinase